MKHTYIYICLMFLFLFLGRVETVYGQFGGTTWGTYQGVVNTPDGETVVELTSDIELKGVIVVRPNTTLKITSKKDVTIRNAGIMEVKDKPENPGRSRFFTVRGHLIIEGQDGAVITLDGGADYAWNNYELIKGSNSRTLQEMIANEGTMTLRNVHIQNVDASEGNSTGGAIYISSGTAVPNGITQLENCSIERCYAQLGSAIMIGGHRVDTWPDLTPENCKVEVINSIITQCVSGGGDDSNSGGAIRTYGNTLSNLYLTNVIMSYNYAKRNTDYAHQFSKDGNGGALFWNGRQSSATACVINGCTFEYNKCDDNGGAIKSQSSISFEGKPTIIQNNQAPNGGGLYIEGYIGGVQLGDARTLTYDLNENLIVRNNTATTYQYEGVNYPGKGAGVHFYFGDAMTLEVGSTINVVMNGAAIEDNVTSGDDGLGGGIYFEDTAPEDKNYTFNINLNYGRLKKNKATAYGGGMYISKGTIVSTAIEGKVMEINENIATLSGGGIYIGEGSFAMNTTGEIVNNKAMSGNGGGIYVGGDFRMTSGTIGNNHADNGNGGGVYVNNGNFTIEQSGIISGNMAGTTIVGNGAGVYINGGNFSMNNGSIRDNVITQGDGGGVFVNGGQLTFNNGAITGNQAGLQHDGNGGGICLLNGDVVITEGEISGNRCGQYGGGLYVHNSGASQQEASFTGGKIVQNNAKYGGGVCVDGNFKLQIGAVIVDKNEAVNGGGICLLNGAIMDFGQGFIRENKATTTETITGTAYKQPIGNVTGIGGGIYLDSNTSLTFSVVNELGLYDNFADNGADDVFANGNNTKVLYMQDETEIQGLPEVSKMKLAGFSVAGEPYWVEDYITNDTQYAEGTNLGAAEVHRYRISIQNLEEVYKIQTAEKLTEASGRYLCLAIGHDIVYVTITKRGLASGESAIFTIHEVKKENTSDTPYRTVLLTGTDNESVSKRVALSTGEWLVKENTAWTWAYKNTASSIQQVISNGTEFEFTNTKNTTLLHDEAKVENSMNGPENNNEP